MTNEQLNRMWDRLIDLGVSKQALQIATSINGYNEQTLKDVLYVVTGYRSFDQLENALNDD